MREIFYNYIDCLLHPVRNHRLVYQRRLDLEKMRRGRLFTLVDSNHEERLKLDFSSYALISWIFVFVSAFYTLAYLHLGLQIHESVLDGYYLPGFGISSNFQQKLILIGLLFDVVFFPLAAWVYVKFWRIVISFFANIFDREVEASAIDDVVNNSLVGNFFLIIPVVDNIFKQLSSVLYVFYGVKHNLRFTTLQSLVIVFSPILMVAMLLLLMAMYIMLIINLL